MPVFYYSRSIRLQVFRYEQLLLHGAEYNMGNIFRVSHILQLILRAFRLVK